MTAEKYTRAVDSECVRVRGGDVAELAEVIEKIAREGLADDGVKWHTDGDAIVFEWPMGEAIVGGRDFLEEEA